MGSVKGRKEGVSGRKVEIITRERNKSIFQRRYQPLLLMQNYCSNASTALSLNK